MIELGQADAAPAAEIGLGEVGVAKELDQFVATAQEIPLGFEVIFQFGEDAVETDLIGAAVLAMGAGENEVTAGNALLGRLGQLADGEISIGNADVERTAIDELGGGVEAR